MRAFLAHGDQGGRSGGLAIMRRIHPLISAIPILGTFVPISGMQYANSKPLSD